MSQTSASHYTPVSVDGLEVWEWTLASPAAASSSVRGAAAAFQGATRSVAAVPLPWPCPFSPPTWCCCCFSAPSQGTDGLLALTIQAGAAKISDLVQEEPVPPSHGAHLPLPCQPQGAAGKGRDGVALHLAHPVLYPLVLEQKGVENCWLWGPG